MYSSSIPKAAEVGEYEVFYKVKGDATHPDSRESSLKVTIQPEKWDGITAADVPVVDNTYYIYTSTQLAGLANLVEHDGFNGKAVLMHDLDLANYNWTPIGSLNHHFKGEFVGNGHVINNLLLADDSAEYAGLFGYVESGVISDLMIRGFEIHGRNHVAVLAGYLGAEADNIEIFGVSGEQTVTGNRFVGGLAGVLANDVYGCKIEHAHIDCGTSNEINGIIDSEYLIKGDKAGAVAGYAANHVALHNILLEDDAVSAFRDEGAVIGCCVGELTIDHITYNVVTVGAADHGGNANDFNIHKEIGFCESLHENDALGVSTITIINLGRGGESTVPDTPVNEYTFEGNIGAIKVSTLAGLVADKPVTINLKNVTIKELSTGIPAINIDGAYDVTIIITGDCDLTGGKAADGIRVATSAVLTLTGNGALKVTGNNGLEYFGSASSVYSNTGLSEYAGLGGSGIGYIDNKPGKIQIVSLTSLSAYGYGHQAYGIGGTGGTVEIINSTIDMARGGHQCEKLVKDLKYGKSEAEGGAGIGGRNIHIFDSIIEKVYGGSKSSAIGEMYHNSTSISIVESEVRDALGGNASAAIGGPRIENDSGNMYVSIYIESSVIKATGGEYGAGIGSGYDTHCATVRIDGKDVPKAQCSLNLVIVSYSVIDATAGRYAANIGTGYHAGNMTGYIDETVNLSATYAHVRTAVDETSPDKNDDNYYKNSYTVTHVVGYGVIDPSREGLYLLKKEIVDGETKYSMPVTNFTVAGVAIDEPVVFEYKGSDIESKQNLRMTYFGSLDMNILP